MDSFDALDCTVHTRNRISVGSADFAGLTNVFNTETEREHATFVAIGRIICYAWNAANAA